jgi:pimeloyl-ACP methyl ester carboxylesterase
MPYLTRDGIRFHYGDRGAGLPFIFQHGLGGDVQQPFGLFRPPTGVRLLSLDCRGHGETRPLGDPDKLSIACYADDVLALMDALSLPNAILGGISLGAAVALNATLRYPERVVALVLSRPAWLDGPNPHNVAIYGAIAALIRQRGAAKGLELFTQSDTYRKTRAISADAAASLVRQFTNARSEETVLKLERLPADAPYQCHRELSRITVPTLVLASRQDPFHPFDYGEVLARSIPAATLRELTPKAVSVDRHAAEVQRFLEEFMLQLVPLGGPSSEGS